MLVGALRSDNPLGGAPLTCDDVTESFTLQGVGEISAAKLLDLENRRQLVWSDLVTREWVLETAAVRVRREAAARAAGAAVAAKAAAESARAAAENAAENAANAATGLVRAAGVPAASTRFAPPPDDGRVAGRLVWSEARPPAGGAPAATGVTADGATATAVAAAERAPAMPDGMQAPAVWIGESGAPAPPGAWTSPGGAPDGPGPAGAPAQAIVTRRADRRRSLKKAERRDRLTTVTGRAVVVALLTVVVVVILIIAQRGGF